MEAIKKYDKLSDCEKAIIYLNLLPEMYRDNPVVDFIMKVLKKEKELREIKIDE